MRNLLLVLGLLAGQDPPEEAEELHRRLEKHLSQERDSESKLRLQEAIRAMRGRAARALGGAEEDPKRIVIRIYDTRNLFTRPKDHPSRDFWKWPSSGGGPLMGVWDGVEDVPELYLGDGGIVDLLKERTGNVQPWEGDRSIERTPNGQILIQAPPSLQRKVAGFLRAVEAESQGGVRASIVLFALAQPPKEIASADGALPEGMYERLAREAEEGGSARRLGGVELAAYEDQVVSAFSGVRHPVNCFPGNAGSTVPDGLAVQLQVVPAPPGYRVEVKLAFTKVLGVEEVGKLRLPKLAEAGMTEQRRVPAARWVRLGLLGPLPPEANLPPHLLVLGRFEPAR